MLYTFAKSMAAATLMVTAIAGAQTVQGTVALPGLPEQLAVDALTNRIYVAVPNFGAEPYDTLSVVDGKTDTVIKNIQIPTIAYAVAVDPFRCIVYVGGTYTDANGISQSEVVAVNAGTYKVEKTIPVSTTAGNGIQGLAVDEVTGNLFVANGSDNEIDVVRNFSVQQRISLEGQPFGVAVNPLLSSVYVSRTDGYVTEINERTGKVTANTAFGVSGAGIAANLLTGKVYAANSVSAPETGSVAVFDQNDQLLTNIPAGAAPLGIDVDFGTNLVFLANSQDNTVAVIDGKTETVKTTLPVSSLFLAVNPVTEKVYVAPATNTTALTVIKEK